MKYRMKSKSIVFVLIILLLSYTIASAQCGDGYCYVTGNDIYGSSDLQECYSGVCLIGYENGTWKQIFYVEAADVFCVGMGCHFEVYQKIREYYGDESSDSSGETYGTSEYSEFCDGNSYDCPDYISPITYPNGIRQPQSAPLQRQSPPINLGQPAQVKSLRDQTSGSSFGENELGYDNQLQKVIYGNVTQDGKR